MSKKFVVGLIVAFVMAAALPLAAQAQIAPTLTCLYKGPLHPLSLNQVFVPGGGPDGQDIFKTIKAQKEIFECYDKKVDDPKALREIVEIELFTVLIEEADGDFIGWDFFATRCVKRLDPRTPPFAQWYVDRCNVITEAALNIDEGEAPLTVDVKKCTAAFGKKPYVGGVIYVADPVEMVTSASDAITKTVKVNKEVFRCFESGDERRPLIYDIELYTEIIEDFPIENNDNREFYGWAWYCVKDEAKARVLGCSFFPGWVTEPFLGGDPRKRLQPENGQLNVSALMPFVTLQSAGVRPSAGKYVFEAQGYNIESVQVQVYNLTGKLVFSAETAGNSLSWNGLSSDGRQLANGVYLYVMTVKGTYGDIVQTKVQKLAILR
ncbi:MAG: gliding motility-associated C-terminal domain-containing protein [Candidatus Bipolaricaulota bacterium]|nr:gliding motility-associated C-terminal domain-containing protein [Candidatus Bipolaricaulota bacterium]MDW8031341.1 gliding motility-associated C-terminal domain-containing protein [Candidatus Bipolaricaulota bacterium]